MSVRKPSKGLTSQTVNKPTQPWRREGKKVEVAMVEKPKKAAKGKKRERGSIPPPFTVSTEELYSILEAWLRTAWWCYLSANVNLHMKKIEVHFTVGTIGGVTTIPSIVMP